MAPTEFDSTHELISALFVRYRKNMQNVAMRILRNRADAEDAVQEAMIKIIRNIYLIDDIDSRRCANFVYTIVKNTAITLYHKKKKEVEKSVTNDVSKIVNGIEDNIDFTVFVGKYDFSEQMEMYIAQLKEIDKDIICLRYGDGFTDEEISDLLDITPANVRKRLSRARQKLAALIERENDGSRG